MFKLTSGTFYRRSRGQVAIAILFVVAIALVFYAFTQNVGKMSQAKALVTVASNSAVSDLASKAISYGQQMYKTNLGGEKKVCGMTGAFASLVGLIIAIIGAILIPFTGGGSVALSIIGIALAAGGLAINTMVIEPMISNAWTKMMKEIMTDNERYLEGALLTGLQLSATDPVLVKDCCDMDGDRRFTGSQRGEDEVSRFALLYQKRIHDMGQTGYVDVLKYLDALEKFMFGSEDDDWSLSEKPSNYCEYDMGDSFVIHDKDSSPLVPSECNPCCLPPEEQSYTDPDLPDNDPYKTINYFMIPDTCKGDYVDPPQGYLTDTCGRAATYPGYPYVFDVSYQNPRNDHYSFLEKLGRDDEHPGFNRRFFQAVVDDDSEYNTIADLEIDSDGDGNPENDPQDIIDRYGHPEVIPQEDLGMHTGTQRQPYYFGDADGYYEEDVRQGVFPFFWQAKHFGTNLNALIKNDRKYPDCLWCDANNPNNMVTDSNGNPVDSTPDIDENVDGNPTNDYVDTDVLYDANGDGNPSNDIFSSKCAACYEDMVILYDTNGVKERIWNLDLESTVESALYNTNYFVDGPDFSQDGRPPVGLDLVGTDGDFAALISSTVWSEGSRFYSNPSWPYQFPTYYQESQMDRMDWIYYGLKEYAIWATHILNNDEFSASQIYKWRQDFMEWRLRLISVNAAINNVLGLITAWENHIYKTDGCEGVGEAWCIPGDIDECTSEPPPGELATFGAGKIKDVIRCLSWNQDNDARFAYCLQQCTVLACTDLPRSLVPDFDPNVNPQTFDRNCDVSDPNNEWARNMAQSIAEARVQKIKMKKRVQFLRALISRKDHLKSVLSEGYTHIQRMIDRMVPDLPKPAPSVIYGWQDESNEALGVAQGRWHYVRVDARLDEQLPWIRTYNKGLFKSRRCYELADTNGTAEVTVTRFDQPYNPEDEEKLKVKFGNDKFLWKFWTYNPADAAKLAALNLSGIPDICKQAGAYATDGNSSEYIEGAFITSPDTACGRAVQPALDLGVSSCTGAQYGFQDAIYGGNRQNAGFSFKFTKCGR